MAKDREVIVYHSLSRHELQKLCKKHGLAANKSNDHMADALASVYKREDLNTKHLYDREVAVQTANPTSHEITVNETKAQRENECMDREYVENFVPEEPVLNGTARNNGVSHPSWNQMEDSFMVDTAFLSFRDRSDSFQFFVECEEGINLCVDLNSSPVHWMATQNYELFIPRQVHDHRLYEHAPQLTARKYHTISEDTAADERLGLQSQVLSAEIANNSNSQLTVGFANICPTQNFSVGGCQRSGDYNKTGEVASMTTRILTKNLETSTDFIQASSVLKPLHGETRCSSSAMSHSTNSFSSSAISSSSASGCHRPQKSLCNHLSESWLSVTPQPSKAEEDFYAWHGIPENDVMYKRNLLGSKMIKAIDESALLHASVGGGSVIGSSANAGELQHVEVVDQELCNAALNIFECGPGYQLYAQSEETEVAQSKERQTQRRFEVHCSQDKTLKEEHCGNALLEASQDQEKRDISRHKGEYKKSPFAKNLRIMKILARGSVVQGDILVRRRSTRLVNKSSF